MPQLNKPRSEQLHRSNWVTAVAIVNFLMGIFKIASGTVLLLAIRYLRETSPPATAPIGAVAIFFYWMLVMVAVLIVVSGILSLLAGYGVIKRRHWGRVLSLVLAGLSGLFALRSAASLEFSFPVFGVYFVFVYIILLNSRFAAEFE